MYRQLPYIRSYRKFVQIFTCVVRATKIHFYVTFTEIQIALKRKKLTVYFKRRKCVSSMYLVRDSSAVRRLFSTCCSRGTSESSTYGKQRICPPTLGQHISTFRGYLIFFSIRNPYINRFTNHFSIHS